MLSILSPRGTKYSTQININLSLNPATNIRGLFLDISKAFDEVQPRELKLYDAQAPLLNLREDYLWNRRQQRILLNGQNFSMEWNLIWHASRLCIGSSFISNLYKSSNRRFQYLCKIFLLMHLYIQRIFIAKPHTIP